MTHTTTVKVLPIDNLWVFSLILIIIMILFCIIVLINIRHYRLSIGRIIKKFKNRILKLTNEYLTKSNDILYEAIDTFTVGNLLTDENRNKSVITEKYELNIGVIPGYNHDNQPEDSSIDYLRDTFYKNLQDICKYVYDETNVYVSFTVIPVKTVYNTDWGCPVGGEESFLISAIRNPKFCDNGELWVNACLRITDMLKNFYNQSTVTGNFHKTLIFYDNGEERPFQTESEKQMNEFLDNYKNISSEESKNTRVILKNGEIEN